MVKPLYNILQVLCLPEMITLELAKYGYKISNKLYLYKPHQLAESEGGLKQHRYPTHFKKHRTYKNMAEKNSIAVIYVKA